MKQKNLTNFRAAVQDFIIRRHRKFITLKPGQKIHCELRIVGSSYVKVRGMRAIKERGKSEEYRFSRKDWRKISKVEFPWRLRALLIELEQSARQKVLTSALTNHKGSDQDSVMINRFLRISKLPFRVYRHYDEGLGGFVFATGIVR